MSAIVTIQPLCSTSAKPLVTRQTTAAQSSHRSWSRSRPLARRCRANTTATASGSDSSVSSRPTVSSPMKTSPAIGSSGMPVSIGSS